MKEITVNDIFNIINQINPYAELRDSVSLFNDGIIDSLGFFSLISIIEEEYSITFSDDDIDINNFATPSSILKTIKKYNSA